MPVVAKDKFNAVSSALGYLHQCRYALYLILDRMRTAPDAQIAIERFDDISFEANGTPLELIQVKHRLGSPPDLTDSSGDLWGTLRVWVHAVEHKIAVLPDTIFTIITTASCPAGSAAMLLKNDGQRNVAKAHALLMDAASKMNGKTLLPAKTAFLALGHQTQRNLLDSVYVMDASPTITDVGEQIQKVLSFAVPKKYVKAYAERLEGWWFGQVIERLAGKENLPISALSLSNAMDDLRARFDATSLPVDFQGAAVPDGTVVGTRVFVEQLGLLKLTPKVINWARTDFYRAFAQRSRWLRDDLLNKPQLDDYDNLLVEEWERLRDWIEQAYAEGEPDEAAIKRGVDLYRQVQQHCRPIRPNCTEPYIGHGSYHMLSDRLRVGWHRDFVARLQDVVGKAQSLDEVANDGMG